MKQPRLPEQGEPAPRPTIRLPKPETEFAGWGPRIRY
jgi:hypothetical protein